MSKSLLFFVFSILSFTTNAQSSRLVDSLLNALDDTKADTSRMQIYDEVSRYYMDNNAGKAIEYLESSLEIAKKLQLPLKVANTHYSIGFCFLMKGDFDNSLKNYLISVRGYENLKDSFRLGNAFMSIGNLYSQNKDFVRTTDYYTRARKLIEAQKDSIQLINILAQTGILYDQLQHFDTALTHLKEALELSRKVGDKNLLTNTMGNVGLTYKHQKNTAKALQYFDSVLMIYKTMDDVAVDNFAAIYNNIAATHSQAANYSQAKEAFLKSVSLAQQSGSRYIEMENYNNLSDMYERMKDFEQQAAYLKKYYNIKDSLFTADNKSQLTQLEADYQVEKKNAEIRKKDVEVNKQKNQRNIFIIIATAAATILATLAFLYRRIKINNGLLKQKNEQINQQNVELETLNKVKDRLFSIISHDLRNPLITLRSYLSLADDVSITPDKKQLFKQNTMDAVSQTCDMLDNLLVWANLQIKSTAANISPVNLEDCVGDVMHTIKIQVLQKNLHLHSNLNAISALGDYTIITIALRNILTNAIKFSYPGGNIYIDTIKREEEVLLTVTDNGIGMTGEQLLQLSLNQNDSTRGTNGEKGSGLGIFLVKELLQKINGGLTITSEPGKGSCFIVSLPSL